MNVYEIVFSEDLRKDSDDNHPFGLKGPWYEVVAGNAATGETATACLSRNKQEAKQVFDEMRGKFPAAKRIEKKITGDQRNKTTHACEWYEDTRKP